MVVTEAMWVVFEVKSPEYGKGGKDLKRRCYPRLGRPGILVSFVTVPVPHRADILISACLFLRLYSSNVHVKGKIQ